MNRQLSRRFLMRALVCGGAASLVSVKGLWHSATATTDAAQSAKIQRSPQAQPTGRRILRHELEADRF